MGSCLQVSHAGLHRGACLAGPPVLLPSPRFHASICKVRVWDSVASRQYFDKCPGSLSSLPTFLSSVHPHGALSAPGRAG